MAFPNQQALDMALIKTADEGNAGAMAVLLQRGANPNAGAGERPALFAAAAANHTNCIRLLLAAGADINACNAKGSTALMAAAFHGQTDAVRQLLEAGADRHLHNKDGTHAQRFAQMRGVSDIIQLLAQDPNEIVVYTRTGDRVIEEIFNFRALERISLVRKAAGAPVEAMFREGFDRIENLPALRDAFDKHRARGGKRSEDEIFPHAADKKPIDKKPGLAPPVPK